MTLLGRSASEGQVSSFHEMKAQKGATMMNKKILSGVSGLILAGTLLTMPALADTKTEAGWGTDDGKTDVTITVASTYTVSIPASLTITAADTADTGTVAISPASQLSTGETLTVAITGQTFEATATYGSSLTSTIPYSVYIGASTTGVGTSGSETVLQKTAAQIGAVDDSTGTIEEDVSIEATAAQYAQADVADNHTGTITFSVGVS
jgi:hypothetical protein